MPEWLNGTVSKTVVGLVSTEGSNPSLPAGQSLKVSKAFRDFLFTDRLPDAGISDIPPK